MVGNPPLSELVEFVKLGLGVVFRIVAHIDPVKYELLDLAAGEFRAHFLDALNGLIEIKPFFSRCTFCSRPNQLPLLGVDLYAFSKSQRTSRTAMDCWPSGESIHSNNPSMKGLFAKMLSASGCSLRGLPMMSSIRSGPSRPVSCWCGRA